MARGVEKQETKDCFLESKKDEVAFGMVGIKLAIA
jgi:hypothetical protein